MQSDLNMRMNITIEPNGTINTVLHPSDCQVIQVHLKYSASRRRRKNEGSVKSKLGNKRRCS